MSTIENVAEAYQAFKFPINLDSSIKIILGIFIVMLVPLWLPIVLLFLAIAVLHVLGEVFLKFVMLDVLSWLKKQGTEYQTGNSKNGDAAVP